MQDRLYTHALKEARKDLGQAFHGGLLPNIPLAFEWKKTFAYVEKQALILISVRSSSFDIGEWNKGSTEPATQYSNDRDASLDWVAENADFLYQKYPDLWILVDGSIVLGAAANPRDLMLLAKERGIKEPFIVITTPPESSDRSVYCGQIV